MCGRMALTVPHDAMAQIFEAELANTLPRTPNFNICPTDDVTVLSGGADRARRLEAMRWGLIPSWYKKENDGPLLINARSETVLEKPAFRDAVHERRVLIVASGFYEWTKDNEGGRDPWYITRRDGAPLLLAALWHPWANPQSGEDVRTVAALTIAANNSTRQIHHRMPVVISARDIGLWLGEQGKGAAPLMQAAPENILHWHRVDRAVNSNRASGANLIDPL